MKEAILKTLSNTIFGAEKFPEAPVGRAFPQREIEQIKKEKAWLEKYFEETESLINEWKNELKEDQGDPVPWGMVKKKYPTIMKGM